MPPCGNGLKRRSRRGHHEPRHVAEKTVPKMMFVARPHAGAIATRTFIPHRCSRRDQRRDWPAHAEARRRDLPTLAAVRNGCCRSSTRPEK